MTNINNMMHQETPYKTIQRTKYIVQVLVCKLAAMSEKNSVCIFGNEGSTSSKRLTNIPDMIRGCGPEQRSNHLCIHPTMTLRGM